MYLVAVSYFQLGQYGSAIHYFEKIIATHQDFLQSRQLASVASVEIAKVYCARGQNQECQAYLYKALFFEPNNQVAKAMIQQYSNQQGQGPGGAPSGDANKMLNELLKK
jgi:tetratricopeptide (TPR) repeat protein